MKKRIVFNSLMVLAAVVLLLPVAAVTAAAPPVVDGRFYGGADPDANDYVLLAQDPGRGDLYYYQDGSTLYLAVVVNTDVNDNVFGNMSLVGDQDYVKTVSWKGQANQHTAKALVNSEMMQLQFACAGQTWGWQQDYVYDSGGTWLSDPMGPDGTKVWPSVLIASASSLAWNFNNSTWPYSGGSSNQDTWKSVDGDGNNSPLNDGYGTYNATYGWEWPLVYEMSLDLSLCGGESWIARIVSAHNSPPKTGTTDIPIITRDYGDAPDSFGTYKASNGPSHQLIVGGPVLGTKVEAEIDSAFPDACACADDVSGYDDEDGVTFTTLVAPGQTATVQVVGTAGAKLDAWVDFNGNGVFDAGEQIASSFTLSGGPDNIDFLVPADATTNDTWARFRVSTAGGLPPTGDAPDGEVEDYALRFSPTAVTLASFEAIARQGAVVLKWQTATELDNLGFNLSPRRVARRPLHPDQRQPHPQPGAARQPDRRPVQVRRYQGHARRQVLLQAGECGRLGHQQLLWAGGRPDQAPRAQAQFVIRAVAKNSTHPHRPGSKAIGAGAFSLSPTQLHAWTRPGSPALGSLAPRQLLPNCYRVQHNL